MAKFQQLIISLTLLIAASAAYGQSAVLEVMFVQSDSVVHVDIVDLALNHTDPTGLTEWKATAVVKQAYKGPMQKDATINFYFSRLEYKRDKDNKPILEELKAQKGKSYIVFIKSGKPLDRWLGIQPFAMYLDDTVKAIQKKMQRAQVVPALRSPSETQY